LGEFTVDIGIVEHHRPVLGVINLPVEGTLYYANVNGSFKQICGKKHLEIRTEKEVYPRDIKAVITMSNFRGAERPL
jgi:3'-phosphoadenosine 5'-phosphosulfate (PAPS) 3'-phosphatase